MITRPPSLQRQSVRRPSRRGIKFESARRFLARLASRRAERRAALLAALLLGSVTFSTLRVFANTELDVPNGTTDLTTLGATATSDLTFTNLTYAPTIFTLGSVAASGTAGTAALTVGTLDDLDATQTLTINPSVGNGGTATLTLSGGTNSVAPNAADLLYVVGGGTLNINALNGTAATNGTLSMVLAASGNFDIAGTANIGAAISGAFAINKTGAGTLTLSNTNTFSGGLTITAGTVATALNTNLGGAGGTAGAITLNGGTLNFTNAAVLTDTHAITIGAAGGTILETGQATTTVNSRVILGNGLLSGSGALTLTGAAGHTLAGTGVNGAGNQQGGAGTLVLGSGNTYSGNITLQNGAIIEYAFSNSLATAATIALGNEAEFTVDSGQTSANAITVNGGTNSVLSFTNGTATLSGPITLNANLTVGLRDWYQYNNAHSGNITGVISGVGGLTTSPGTATTGNPVLTLTNTNTYTGATTIAANTTLQLGNGATTGSLSTSSAITDNGTFTLNRSNAVAQGTDFSGAAITGTGGLTKLGAGTLTLNAANTYSGATLLSAGTLQLQANAGNTTGGVTSVIGGSTVLTLASGTTLQLLGNTNNTIFGPGGTPAANSLTTGILETGSGPFNIFADNNGSGTGNTLILANFGQFGAGATSPTFNFSSGDGYNLQIGSGTAGTGVLDVFNNTVINNNTAGTLLSLPGGIDINFGAGYTVTFGGVGNITTGALKNTTANSTFNLAKSGTGTLTLNGANTYTGGTTVNGGILAVTGSISASNTILVGTGATGGALYQSGTSSVVTNTNAGGGGFQIGSAVGALGYYNLSGGTVNVAGEIDPGGSGGGAGTFGQLDVSGGTINLGTASNTTTPYFLPVRGAAGEASVVNVSGGTIQINPGNTVANGGITGLSVGLNNVGNLNSTITLSGTGQILTAGHTVKLNDTNFGGAGNATNVSVLNLNGGTLQTLGFGAAANQGTTANGNANAVLNFNGGTLRAGTAGNTTFIAGLGAANVYSGGGTIDNNAQAITISQALLAPGGTGVSAVPVGTAGAGYVVPPRVVFTGGTTTGGLGSNTATGYATIDPVTGAVTGIVITNPGSYTSTSGLTASFVGSGTTTATTGTLAINSGNTSGGIVFTGTGTTRLKGANTYTGATAISSGTVITDGSNTILGNSSAISIASGATLDINGNTAEVVNNLSGSGALTSNFSTTTSGVALVNSANTTFSGVISNLNNNGTGTFGLSKSGAGNLTLSGVNTYIGATSITGGQLTLNVANTLATTSGITVGSNSTLSLAATNALATPGTRASGGGSVAGQVAVTLGGGTLLRNGSGVSLGSQSGTAGTVGIGMLTLTAASTLDFGTTGVGTLNFNSFADANNAFLLTVTDYTHPTAGAGTDGTDDRLIFNQDLSGFLTDFSINGQTPTQIALGNGEFELTVTAVPEPSTWVAGMLLVGALGFRQRRRVTGMFKRQSVV